MDSVNFDKIKYDYNSNNVSYVGMILDMLPENMLSKSKRQVIIELYNYILSRMDDEKIKEISLVSKMFRDKVSMSNLNEIARHAEYIYLEFLNKIVFDADNRIEIFNVMHECEKVFVGYFSTVKNRQLDASDSIYSYNMTR